MSGKEIIAYLAAEGKVVLQAPVSFATCVLIALLAIWGALNWRYSGQIDNLKSQVETKEGTITSKEALISDYKDKLSGATPDEAKKRLDALELQVAALSPRRLTEAQKGSLAKIASQAKNSTIEVDCDMAAADARAFTADIAKAFNFAGWKVELPLIMGPSNPPQTGTALRVSDPANLTVAEKIAKASLEAANISFDIQPVGIRPGAPDFSVPGPDVTILITSR